MHASIWTQSDSDNLEVLNCLHPCPVFSKQQRQSCESTLKNYRNFLNSSVYPVPNYSPISVGSSSYGCLVKRPTNTAAFSHTQRSSARTKPFWGVLLMQLRVGRTISILRLLLQPPLVWVNQHSMTRMSKTLHHLCCDTGKRCFHADVECWWVHSWEAGEHNTAYLFSLQFKLFLQSDTLQSCENLKQ